MRQKKAKAIRRLIKSLRPEGGLEYTNYKTLGTDPQFTKPQPEAGIPAMKVAPGQPRELDDLCIKAQAKMFKKSLNT